MKKCKIISINKIGVRPTFNVTMKSEQHNYAIISSGKKMYSRNSHAIGYAINETYITGFLKAHYPIEFMASRLSVECRRRKEDLVNSYCDEVRRLGFKILPADINLSTLDWQIVDQKTLREPLIVKNIGIKAAKEIMANRPYDKRDILFSFAQKSGRSITTKIVEAMYDAGIWGRDKSKAKIIELYETIKKDKKRKKPSGGADIF